MTDILEVIYYKGHEIHVMPDFDPVNPWTDWDTNPPLLDYGDRLVQAYGDDLRDLPLLTDSAIRGNAKDIAAALGEPSLLRAVGYERYNYSLASDAINDALSDYAAGCSGADLLEIVEQVWAWSGAETLRVGDRLLVATPKWLTSTGVCADHAAEALAGSARLFDDWASGAVYGFDVPSIGDSCWGFYGWDHDKSGLLAHARDAIDRYAQ